MTHTEGHEAGPLREDLKASPKHGPTVERKKKEEQNTEQKETKHTKKKTNEPKKKKKKKQKKKEKKIAWLNRKVLQKKGESNEGRKCSDQKKNRHRPRAQTGGIATFLGGGEKGTQG